MKEMIACCGLVCTECPAYIATRNGDDELRKKTAADWSKFYGHEIKPEDITCEGCQSESGKTAWLLSGVQDPPVLPGKGGG